MPDADGKVVYEVRADGSKVSSDLDSVGKDIEKHGSKWDSVLTGVGQAIGSNITDMAINAAKAVWELGTGFENGLAKVSTLVDTASVDMEALGDSLLNLSSKYGIEAEGLAESAYNAISSNNALAQDTAGLMSVLESSTKLAKAGFTDVDTATSATLKTLNAYGLGVEEADRIQKILIQTQNVGITTVGELGSVLANVTPTAAAMGVSFENVGAALGTMTAQGTPAAQATTQLNSLFAELGKQGTQAALALEEATEGTKYAGMSFQELTAAGVPLNEILGLMDASAQKNGVTMIDMFSSIEAGKAALSMTGQGAQTFTQNLAAMSTETDVVGAAFDKVSNTSSENLNKSLTGVKNVAIELFQAISPLITVVLDLAASLINAISSALRPTLDAIQPLIDILKVLGQVFSSVISGQITYVLSLFSGIIQNTMNTAKGVLDEFITFVRGVFAGNWRSAWEGIKSIFSSIVSGWAGIFKAPINAIIDGINAFTSGLSKIKIPDWVPGVGGKSFSLPKINRLAVGADYIPYNGYPAVLHQGEAVLTAAEAKAWRAGINSRDADAVAAGAGTGGIDYDKLARAMSGLRVVMDGKTVGRLVEPSVSTAQARKLESMQRSGFNGRV